MADIAASNVTYAFQEGSQFACPSDPMMVAQYKLTFGNGTLTYPAGGIPLLAASMGCPAKISSLELLDPNSPGGYVYKYDRTNNKLRMYQIGALDGNAAAAQALTELVSGTTAPAAQNVYVKVKGY